MKINPIDHIVLTVSDIQEVCDFYARALGMDVVVFGFVIPQLALRDGGTPILPIRNGHGGPYNRRGWFWRGIIGE